MRQYNIEELLSIFLSQNTITKNKRKIVSDNEPSTMAGFSIEVFWRTKCMPFS